MGPKHIILATTALLILSSASCDDDGPEATAESAAVTLEVTGQMLTESLELETKTYLSPTVAEGFRPTRTSFYLSDIRLVQEANGGQRLDTEVAEVAYVELGPFGKTSLTFEGVPTGEYSALRFTLGLSEELDATTPADYTPQQPLGRQSEYWQDWNSYIFLKLEGRADTLADGIERFDAAFAYHVGKSAEYARAIEIPLSMEVKPEGTQLPIRVDVGTLLGLATSEPLPLGAAADHRNNFAEKIMDRSAAAFSVDQ